MSGASDVGLPPEVERLLREFFAARPDIERVWLFGSHARGEATSRSDVDFAVDAPALDRAGFAALVAALDDLALVRGVDIVHWQAIEDAKFRAVIERERLPFWPPPPPAAERRSPATLELKDYQRRALEQLGRYVDQLSARHAVQARAAAALQEAGVAEQVKLDDFSEQAWNTLKEAGSLPAAQPGRTYTKRLDGAGQPIPNVCLKVPTGGGKTLLAAAAVGLVHSRYLRRHAGVVLWIVPNDAIYRQTLKALSDRDHPYRQLLNSAGAGRVKILEKSSPLTAEQVSSHLCVLVLMLASAARQSKETLRFFRDRGNVHGFFPREDDIDAHWRLLERVPNLDIYAPPGADSRATARQKGSIVKDSLGNVMRLLRPMVVIDEQQRAYTENALATIDGFNPAFLLELSATPRSDAKTGRGANILVDVRGTDLDAEQMIKLPINVDVRPWPDWQACLRASLERLDALEREARALEADSLRYIRPILLVQVERTGADQIDAGHIHADDARALLLQLGLRENQIAIKSAEKDELLAPENLDLLSPACPVRAIITKQALQEGWDCPFAYVLCALAAGRNPSALTQLVGRILRQPHALKTGRAALDECHVFCNDAQTGEVIRCIKDSLEQEGMGDLQSAVRVGNGGGNGGKERRISRRKGLEAARIFLPRVAWSEGGRRRELDYESDVVGTIDWTTIDLSRVVAGWAPPEGGAVEKAFRIDLRVLGRGGDQVAAADVARRERLDRVYLARAIADLLPNAWSAYALVEGVVARLLDDGVSEARIAGASDLLIQQMRADLERQREALAESAFMALLSAGRIEFCLRADRLDYELPRELSLSLPDRPRRLRRPDDDADVERSLFDPFYEEMLDNGFERDFACYLDGQAALRWWHRNVARAGYGLQGWRRNKVYPDFVFVKTAQDGRDTLVVMETKGVHLANEDTGYKRRLLEMLEQAYRDHRLAQAGELELVSPEGERLVCGLVFDQNWRNALQDRYLR